MILTDRQARSIEARSWLVLPDHPWRCFSFENQVPLRNGKTVRNPVLVKKLNPLSLESCMVVKPTPSCLPFRGKIRRSFTCLGYTCLSYTPLSLSLSCSRSDIHTHLTTRQATNTHSRAHSCGEKKSPFRFG